eukprot:3081000-Rhodomonas_salina.1
MALPRLDQPLTVTCGVSCQGWWLPNSAPPLRLPITLPRYLFILGSRPPAVSVVLSLYLPPRSSGTASSHFPGLTINLLS